MINKLISLIDYKIIPIIRRHIFNQDVRETITPVQLRHFSRYFFAKNEFQKCKLLDIACGTGYGSEILRSANNNVIGMDISENAISYAKKNFPGRYETGDIQNLQFSDNYFDGIVCFETIEHVDDDDKAIIELKRVLKVNGVLIISIPLHHPDTIYHKKIYDYESARKLLEKHFKTVEIYFQQGDGSIIKEGEKQTSTLVARCKQ